MVRGCGAAGERTVSGGTEVESARCCIHSTQDSSPAVRGRRDTHCIADAAALHASHEQEAWRSGRGDGILAAGRADEHHADGRLFRGGSVPRSGEPLRDAPQEVAHFCEGHGHQREQSPLDSPIAAASVVHER